MLMIYLYYFIYILYTHVEDLSILLLNAAKIVLNLTSVGLGWYRDSQLLCFFSLKFPSWTTSAAMDEKNDGL